MRHREISLSLLLFAYRNMNKLSVSMKNLISAVSHYSIHKNPPFIIVIIHLLFTILVIFFSPDDQMLVCLFILIYTYIYLSYCDIVIAICVLKNCAIQHFYNEKPNEYNCN